MSDTPSAELKIYASIGVICVQWALLEMNLLRILACVENQPMDKIYMSYAGLDMLPRVNMAIKLTRHAKWPLSLVKRLEAVRKALQGNNGLADKRNQFVHGVHGPSSTPECITLTMARWEGPKRTQTVSVPDAYTLAFTLQALGEEVWGIADAYGVWKFGSNANQDRGQHLVPAKASIWVEVVQHVQGAVKRIFGNR